MIAEVQEAERQADGSVDVIVDHGGNAKKTAEHFGPAGDDSPPLPGDFAALVPARGTGRELALGYDDATKKEALPGEKRIYGRDASGKVVSSLHMKRDGSGVFQCKGGEIVMTPDGVATYKAATMIFDTQDLRVGKGAGRPLALVGDPVMVSVNPAPLPGQVQLTGAGQILGPGSIVGKG